MFAKVCLTISKIKSPRHSPQGLKENLGSIPGLLSSQASTVLLSALSRTEFFMLSLVKSLN